MDSLPIEPFATQKEWEKWLHEHHKSVPGVWIKIFKKHTGIPTVTHDEALDVALCYGWIDGQAKPIDEQSYMQKFCPRRKKSIWSKRNTEKAEDLIKAGLMHTSGLVEIEKAKADGRWDAAYNSPKNMTFPVEFMEALSENKKAEAFFNTLNKSNKYAISWRLETAKKPETKKKRMNQILEMLEKEEKFH